MLCWLWNEYGQWVFFWIENVQHENKSSIHCLNVFSELVSFTVPLAVMEKHSLLTPQPRVPFTSFSSSVKKENLGSRFILSGPFSIYSMDFPWLSRLGETEMKGFWLRNLKCNKPVGFCEFTTRTWGRSNVELFYIKSDTVQKLWSVKWNSPKTYP